MCVAQCKCAFGCIVEHIHVYCSLHIDACVYIDHRKSADQELKVIANGVRNGLACIYMILRIAHMPYIIVNTRHTQQYK